MIDRESAFQLLESQSPEPHLIHHAIQTEAVMTGLAKHFGEDETLWSLTGLLHDLDFPSTKETPEEHGKQSVELLKGKLPEIALDAILAHNSEHTAHDPTTKLDLALRCAETVTGLIATNALVRPNGMEGMKPKSLKKKMKDKAFAASVSRDRIKECEKLNLELGQFFELAIESITPIADAAGLAKRT